MKCVGKDADGKYQYEEIENGLVWAAVFLTSTKGNDFSYKNMDETENPFYYDCPKSILELLSATDNELAMTWRKRCYEKIEKNKSGLSLSKVPIGTAILWEKGDEEIRLIKHAPAYQFIRPFWVTDKFTYVPSRRIKNWHIA